MTNILALTDNKLAGVYERLKRNRRRMMAAAFGLYTLLFLLYFFIADGRTLAEYGYTVGIDGREIYLSALTQFRRDLLAFFGSFADGSPGYPMVNPDYGFGMDTLGPLTGYFIPLLPYYVFSVFLPESAMASFMTGGMVILTYLSGITMIIMCVHFGKDPLLSAALSPLYVFCGWYMTNGWANPHFLYATAAFPLMIVGIDRIINGRSGILLTLSVAFAALSSLILLFYTVPFVIIFAAIRVYYVHKKTFFRSLGKYFAIGALYTLLGVMTASFILLPGTGKLLMTSRMSGGSPELADMLVPNLDRFSAMLRGFYENMTACYGTWLAALPFFIYSVICPGEKKELRSYSTAAVILMLLPATSFAVNAFKYELCRWGFVPAALMCYTAAEYVPTFVRPKKGEAGAAVFICLLYIAAISVCSGKYAAVIFLAAALISFITPVRRFIAKTAEKAFGKYRSAVTDFKGDGRYRAILVIFVSVVAAVIVVLLMVWAGLPAKVCTAVFLTLAFAAAVLTALLTKNKAIPAFMVICTFAVSGLLYHGGIMYDAAAVITDQQTATFAALAEDRLRNTVSGRYCCTDDVEYNIFASDDESRREMSFDDILSDSPLFTSNASMLYGIPSAEIFNSTISGDYIGFLDRIGMDGLSLQTGVVTNGYSGKEVVYSLFGIRNLYSHRECPYIYGARTYREIPVEGFEPYYLYTNDYALPLGVTYDRTMSKERYDSFSSAALPYAMMNEVWLDGYSSSVNDADTAYSEECDIGLEKTYRGSTESGTRCYDNVITINTDTAGCFLYISFDGVQSGSEAVGFANDLMIDVDDGMTHNFKILNPMSSFQWKYDMDHYTLTLGYREDSVKELRFVSPFDYSSVRIYKVPLAAYTEAYEQRCAETLENIETGINTLSGSIDLTADRILSIDLMYSTGWKAYDNGTEVPVYKANGLFMGIPLSAGHHDIKLVYHTPFIIPGIALSALSIVIIIIISVISSKKKGQQK